LQTLRDHVARVLPRLAIRCRVNGPLLASGCLLPGAPGLSNSCSPVIRVSILNMPVISRAEVSSEQLPCSVFVDTTHQCSALRRREALPTLRYFPNDTKLALGELHDVIQVFCVRQEDKGGVNRGS